MCIDTGDYFSRTIAVPSWVISGSIAENALFLKKAVHGSRDRRFDDGAACDVKKTIVPAEVGLCFFETSSCLQYGEDDLPHWLSDLPFLWHVHLPMDLPWEQGGEKAASIAIELMGKVDFLGARRVVLHPPCLRSTGEDIAALRGFFSTWQKAGRQSGDVLIENVRGCDLTALADVICKLGVHVCLDTGHILAYRQYQLLENSDLLDRVRMVHLNAPDAVVPSKHLSLSELTEEGLQVVTTCLQYVPSDAVLMLEIFDWDGIQRSLPVLTRLLSNV